MSNCVPHSDHSRCGVVVFARSDSKRLPGKVLRPLAGRPMLGWTIARMQRSRLADVVALATSERPCDDQVAQLADEAGIPVIRGSCNDVLDRAKAAMLSLSIDVLVRISGDSPFADARIVDDLLAQQAESGADVVTNVHPERRLVPGLSVEVMNRNAMNWLVTNTLNKDDREHVTASLYRNANAATLPLTVASGGPRLEGGVDMSLAVDTAEEFAVAEAVARELGQDLEQADWRHVVALYRRLNTATAARQSARG